MKTILLALFLPLVAMADDCGRSHCSWRHCNKHCPRPVVVTNKVAVTVTNNVLVHLPGIDVRDFTIQRGHIYRIIVSTRATPEWRSWAVARCTSNQTARVIFPALPKAGVLWQIRDVTPGFAGTVIDGREPDPEAEVVRYLLIRRGQLQKL